MDAMTRLSFEDELDQPWVSVLVPWNAEDAEMAAAAPDLRNALWESLPRKLHGVPRRCEMAAAGIPTLADFGELLPQMARIMLKRFRKDEAVPVFPPEGPPRERPPVPLSRARPRRSFSP